MTIAGKQSLIMIVVPFFSLKIIKLKEPFDFH